MPPATASFRAAFTAWMVFTRSPSSSYPFMDHSVSAHAHMGITQNRMITTGLSSIREMRLVWNKVNSRDKPRLCEIIDNYMEKLGLSSLDTVLVRSSKFEKDGMETGNGAIFRSTMLPPDKRLVKGSNLEELVKEIRFVIHV